MHWLQNHWHSLTPLHMILYPVSLVFRALTAFRRAAYRNKVFPSDQLLLPVIVVGNVSVGGTGKTPLTLALAQQFTDRGWHPLIISRGYGGKSKKPQQVLASSIVQEVGDEPLLMARRGICPVWIGRDRVNTAHAAMQAHPQCNVVLCDDGLQHYRLQRDFEIAVVDNAQGFGNGFLLPAGPLREPIKRLHTVDALVVNKSQSESISEINDISLTQHTMYLSGELFTNLHDPGQTVAADHFYATSNHAIAGIGHPQRFFRFLEKMGIPFTQHAFPDHHPYSKDELAYANCEALLMTEKDAVKCSAFADARYWELRVDAQIDHALIEQILRKIKSHGFKTA